MISDPLRQRISLFDSQGRFRQAWKIGFAADSINVLPNDLVLVRQASTGQLHVFDHEGHQLSAVRPPRPEPTKARVSAGNGTVIRPATGLDKGGRFEVPLGRPGLTLLSLQVLATDRAGNTYVALETTAGGDVSGGITINKFVRKYAADGRLVCEVERIPLDYYVTPVDELRIRNNIVYQLMTTSSDVLINEWVAN